jgi:hypothetical protein
MLTVLGLMRITREDHCLFLLDEPDTHLNPIWKLRYFDDIEGVLTSDDHGDSVRRKAEAVADHLGQGGLVFAAFAECGQELRAGAVPPVQCRDPVVVAGLVGRAVQHVVVHRFYQRRRRRLRTVQLGRLGRGQELSGNRIERLSAIFGGDPEAQACLVRRTTECGLVQAVDHSAVARDIQRDAGVAECQPLDVYQAGGTECAILSGDQDTVARWLWCKPAAQLE